MPETPTTSQILTCPKCGGTETFRYLEDIVSHRTVTGFDKHGILRIDGFYRTGEGYDDGHDPRLECHNEVLDCRSRTHHKTSQHTQLCYRECCHEFPIPDGIEYDFD